MTDPERSAASSIRVDPGRVRALATTRYDETGPISLWAGHITLILSLLVGLQVFPAPGVAPKLIFLLGAGSAALSPRESLLHFPISMSVIAYLSWMMASMLWTNEPTAGSFFLQRDLPIVLAVILVAGTLPLERLAIAFVHAIRLVVIISLISVALFASSRTHFDATGLSPELPGWHGLFAHKNQMTPVLLVGTVGVMAFDHSRWPRILTVLGVMALIAGSSSGTGVAGVALSAAIWIWIQIYRRFDHRFGSAFLLSTLSVLTIAIIGVSLSINAVVEAYGKDVTFTGRTFIWAATISAIKTRPWFGYGIGGLFWSSEPPSPETAAAWREIGFRVPHAHNGVLDLTVQYGLIGLALYASVFFSVLSGGWRLTREHHLLGNFVVVTMLVLAFVSISEPVFAGQWFIIPVFLQMMVIRVRGEHDRGREVRLLSSTHTRRSRNIH